MAVYSPDCLSFFVFFSTQNVMSATGPATGNTIAILTTNITTAMALSGVEYNEGEKEKRTL